jgi:hypothetical protein
MSAKAARAGRQPAPSLCRTSRCIRARCRGASTASALCGWLSAAKRVLNISLALRALPFDLVNDKLIGYREIKLTFDSNSRVEQDVILARRKPPHQLTGLSVRRGR